MCTVAVCGEKNQLRQRQARCIQHTDISMRPQGSYDSFNCAVGTRDHGRLVSCLAQPGKPVTGLALHAHARGMRVQRRHHRVQGVLRLLRRRTAVVCGEESGRALQPASHTVALVAVRVSRATNATSRFRIAATNVACCSASEAAMLRGTLRRASGVRVCGRTPRSRARRP